MMLIADSPLASVRSVILAPLDVEVPHVEILDSFGIDGERPPDEWTSFESVVRLPDVTGLLGARERVIRHLPSP